MNSSIQRSGFQNHLKLLTKSEVRQPPVKHLHTDHFDDVFLTLGWAELRKFQGRLCQVAVCVKWWGVQCCSFKKELQAFIQIAAAKSIFQLDLAVVVCFWLSAASQHLHTVAQDFAEFIQVLDQHGEAHDICKQQSPELDGAESRRDQRGEAHDICKPQNPRRKAMIRMARSESLNLSFKVSVISLMS